MSTHKTFWLSLGLILVACLSTWLMVKNHHGIAKNSINLKLKPDAYMYNATYYQFNNKGILDNRLEAQQATHIPHENKTIYTEPDYLMFTKDRLPWYISAKNGTSLQGVELINLRKNVVLFQPATDTRPATKILTTVLTVHPKLSTADTAAHVTILRPGSTVLAKGMHVNFHKNTINLLSQSQGTYEETVAEPNSKGDNSVNGTTDN